MQEDSAWLSGGPYTYFVPTDEAFIAAAMPLSVINTMNRTELLTMLKYMIVKGRISSTTLAGFFRQTVSTLSPERPMLTKNYFGIFFNGIAMEKANINLGDAVVHTMKNVGIPPVGECAGHHPEQARALHFQCDHRKKLMTLPDLEEAR